MQKEKRKRTRRTRIQEINDSYNLTPMDWFFIVSIVVLGILIIIFNRI